MEKAPAPPRPTPEKLRTELERSQDDLQAGRLAPLRPALAAMHGRASRRRIERRQQAE